MQRALTILASLSILIAPGIALAAPEASFCANTDAQSPTRVDGPISFLSDSDPAYAYLEGLQEIAYTDNPAVRRWTGSAKDQAAIREVIAMLDERAGANSTESYGAIYDQVVAQLRRGMPTRFENPQSMFILCSVALAVHSEIAREIPSFVMPYLGTLPSGTLNARALKVPNSEAELITVNFSLFTFVHELGKIGLGTIRIETERGLVAIDHSDDYFKLVRSDPQFLTRFSMALEDFANQRMIHGHSPPRALDDPLLQAMDAALEEFVVAHEFAHIVLGHTRRDTEVANFSEGSQLSDAALRQHWGEEAIADLYAAALVQRIAKARNRAASAESLASELGEFVRYAPVLFLQLNHIAEEAHYVHNHAKPPPTYSEEEGKAVLRFLVEALEAQGRGSGVTPATTPVPAIVRQFGDHPPAWTRRALVTAYWRSEAQTPKSETETAFGVVAISMGNNLELLWSDLAPAWVKIAQKEKSPQ